jgi:hypothetical protein
MVCCYFRPSSKGCRPRLTYGGRSECQRKLMVVGLESSPSDTARHPPSHPPGSDPDHFEILTHKKFAPKRFRLVLLTCMLLLFTSSRDAERFSSRFSSHFSSSSRPEYCGDSRAHLIKTLYVSYIHPKFSPPGPHLLAVPLPAGVCGRRPRRGSGASAQSRSPLRPRFHP